MVGSLFNTCPTCGGEHGCGENVGGVYMEFGRLFLFFFPKVDLSAFVVQGLAKLAFRCCTRACQVGFSSWPNTRAASKKKCASAASTFFFLGLQVGKKLHHLQFLSGLPPQYYTGAHHFLL